MFFNNNQKIKSWRDFAWSVRGVQEKILNCLDDYPDSVLVTGCQRSGGTMLARVITNSDGMMNYWFSNDDELDAAQILSGRVEHEPRGRYCFQTTYLNERYSEYFEHQGQRIVWSLRNPHSVVYSMVYNWKRFALNELFLQCGFDQMDYRDRIRFQKFGILGVPPIRRAAYAFNGKISQLFDLKENYPEGQLTVLDYDTLVMNKNTLLPLLYERIDVDYKPEYAEAISERSLNKKNSLKPDEKEIVEYLCMPVYEAALELINLK
ncbi:hypothetical protein [Amphritea pacifica]|uniref:hypothetical protein n=1 Tax=Amphritea pacifica TaxID=2811233 RepID=UPI0019668F0B|nr:hypothetical protein [Amphritea pacifica]MBN1008729.1 hypothetical protein [Amphritea pacifica]